MLTFNVYRRIFKTVAGKDENTAIIFFKPEK